MKLVLFQPFDEQTKSGPVPPQNLYAISAFGAEHKQGARKGIRSCVSNKGGQAVEAFSEVHRL
jgi:hypothetical protein